MVSRFCSSEIRSSQNLTLETITITTVIAQIKTQGKGQVRSPILINSLLEFYSSMCLHFLNQLQNKKQYSVNINRNSPNWKIHWNFTFLVKILAQREFPFPKENFFSGNFQPTLGLDSHNRLLCLKAISSGMSFSLSGFYALRQMLQRAKEMFCLGGLSEQELIQHALQHLKYINRWKIQQEFKKYPVVC